GEHHTQPVIRGGFPWVVRNPLLICLGCFIQLSGYGVIVVGGDLQFFPFAGMFPQLECLGVVLAGSPWFVETEVVVAYCPIAHSKIRIKLDGTLMVRQACGGA